MKIQLHVCVVNSMKIILTGILHENDAKFDRYPENIAVCIYLNSKTKICCQMWYRNYSLNDLLQCMLKLKTMVHNVGSYMYMLDVFE